jgi:uncharacterized membrane protein
LDVLTGVLFGLLSSYGFYLLYQLLSKTKSGKHVGGDRKRRKSIDGFPQNEVNQLNFILAIVLIVCLLSSYYLTW